MFVSRALRILNTYLPLTASNAYQPKKLYVQKEKPHHKLYNIPGSAFLKSYSRKLSKLDNLKLWGIKHSMKHAAKNGLVYHLWWHPHNFGNDVKTNMKMLGQILCYYKELNRKYGMLSLNMDECSKYLE